MVFERPINCGNVDKERFMISTEKFNDRKMAIVIFLSKNVSVGSQVRSSRKGRFDDENCTRG